ncbi:MAG: ABC transporter ATP-binding protein [Planctomycetes bacterium]|nr:ABC transporter ATP-binding protein [Planctomycetota bacterium]
MSAPTPVLRAEGLTVAYGDFVALDRFDAVLEGGTCGLLGPNGAGKSSLLRTLLGLIAPTAGKATVLGLDVETEGLALRRRVGYMPERDAFVPSASAVQTLTYLGRLGGLDAREARSRAHETLYFVGLGEARYRSPEEFSTGMRQRARLAAALVHDPELVILDEPTNGLDPAGRDAMLGLVRAVASRGVHVLLASHLLTDVEQVCERVLVLDKGRLLASGEMKELVRADREVLRVRLNGERAPFEAALAKRSAIARVPEGRENENGFELLVEGLSPRELFAAAMECGQVVLALREERRSLEQVFLEALQGNAR